MKIIGGKRKRSLSCEKNTEMKCPLSAEPLVSCCTHRVTKAVGAPDHNLSPRKKCNRESVKCLPLTAESNCKLSEDTPGKGKENKGCLTPEPLAKTIPDEAVRVEGLSDDSGYLSLQNSHNEHDSVDFGKHLGGVLEESVSSLCSVKSTQDVTGLSASTLPILRFQQEVCCNLMETFKKTQSYDWSVISRVANNSGIHNVIGGKMGLECVDILSSLSKKDMKHILTRILRLLGDVDLISCKKVCEKWREIIGQDQSALKRCREAEQRKWKELKPTGSRTPKLAPSRGALSVTQPVTSTPVRAASRNVAKDAPQGQTSHFHKYLEVAKTLKQDEGLKRCRQCSSPARYNSGMKRAVCTRASCAYDFCTLCLADFHGSSPCRRGVLGSPSVRSVSRPGSSVDTHLPCSKQSKRSIRRL